MQTNVFRIGTGIATNIDVEAVVLYFIPSEKHANIIYFSLTKYRRMALIIQALEQGNRELQ
jgi:hypothetical protein